MTLQLRMNYGATALCTLITMSLFGACKNSTPSPTPQVEQPQESTETTQLKKEQPVVAELTSEQKQKIFKALGCPEEAITETGCKQCPSAVEYWTSAPRDENSPAIEIKLEQGFFGGQETEGKQVLASFGGCNQHTTDSYHQEFTHLTEHEDGSWKLLSTTSVEAPYECEQIKVSDTSTRTLCAVYDMLTGAREMALKTYLWDKPEVSEGAIASPTIVTVLKATEYDSCKNNLVVKNDVQHKIEDVNSDGLSDLLLEVTHMEGPHTGGVLKCTDKPKRESKTSSFTYTYVATPDGYMEKDGKKSEIPHSPELDEFF